MEFNEGFCCFAPPKVLVQRNPDQQKKLPVAMERDERMQQGDGYARRLRRSPANSGLFFFAGDCDCSPNTSFISLDSTC